MFSGSCADKDVSYIFNIFKDFPDPGWKNVASLKAQNIKLDSSILTISVKANAWIPSRNEFSTRCLPDSKLLYSHKIMIYLTTKVTQHILKICMKFRLLEPGSLSLFNQP